MSRTTVPSRVLDAFADQSVLPLARLAPAMGMDIKTLRKHVEAQNLPVHIKGTGVVRRHYVCTLDDVAEFYRRTGEACQSSRSEIRPTTSSISRSKVCVFPGPRNAGMNVTLRTSKRRGARLETDRPDRARRALALMQDESLG